MAKRLIARLGVAVCAAAICITASATAAPPRGTLTATEYRQLAVATATLNSSASSGSIDWTKARAACNQVSKATPLLRTQRATCFGEVNVLEALARFPAEQRRCPKTTTKTGTTTTGTTTTGTTTTGTTTNGPMTAADSSQIRLLICMNSHYQALSRAAKAIDVADIAARKQALDRGFSGSCLAALAPTPADLVAARRFASASGKLAADVTLLIRVTDGRLPASDFNQTRIDNDVKLFENAATAVLVEHGQPKLSICPHE